MQISHDLSHSATSGRLLGVNVDHVATIREARGTNYPDPVDAALLAIAGGADQITIHLREDRRHIQDHDLERMKRELAVPLNLEMANAPEIVKIACSIRPATATLVPEKRGELTTEGGLDVVSNLKNLSSAIDKLKQAGISVSLFIDPEIAQIEASLKLGADAIELHTGAYCDAGDEIAKSSQMERLVVAERHAAKTKMKLCAGHGINYSNASQIARALRGVVEYNIGHAIVARAIMAGMEQAVREMKAQLQFDSSMVR